MYHFNIIFIVVVSLSVLVQYGFSLLIDPNYVTRSTQRVQDFSSINSIPEKFEIHRARKLQESSTTRTGFTKFAERLNGRAAMIGLTVGLGNELLTGHSLVDQFGVASEPQPILIFTALALAMMSAAKSD